MKSYKSFSKSITPQPRCKAVFQNRSIDIPLFDELEALCNSLASYDGDWAEIVKGMINEASLNYGDANLADRLVSTSNRVDPMKHTELFIQMSLAPNSRTRFVPNGAGIYLGPNKTNDHDNNNNNDGDKDIYSVPMGVQYSVTQNGEMYYSTDLDDGGTSLDYSISLDKKVSTKLNYPKEYKEFGLYPKPDFNVVIDPSIDNLMPTNSTLTTPFKGTAPTIAMVAAASSAGKSLLNIRIL